MDLSYCEILQKNKPQSNSIAGGVILLTVSGMHIGWGIWRIQIAEPWAFHISIGIIQFTLMSWYVFAVFGSIIGAVLVTKIRKKSIYYVGGTLLIISNIMFIALDREHEAIIIGRCFAGLAHGIIYNATITHAAENVVKDLRGMLLSSINCILFSGVFAGTILIASVTNDDSVTGDFLFGIFGIVLTVLGIICTIFLTYESIPYLLIQDNESEAIINLLKLRNESVMTPKLTNDLDEMRLMVGQDKQENRNIFSDGNGSATGKMVVLRVLSTMTNNYLINGLLISMVALLLHIDNFHLAPVILSACRLVGSLIPVLSTEFIKRKIHLTVSSVTSGSLMLILAIVIATVTFYSTSPYWILAALSVTFQIFASLGIDPMQHLLLSEAFSTSKKAWSVALVTSFEYCLQVLFIAVTFLAPLDTLRVNAVLFATAGVMLAVALFLQLAIPETFKKSIKETRDLFRT